MKKAFLYSVLILWIAGVLLVTTFAFIDRAQFQNEIVTKSVFPSKVSYLREQVINDYFEILGFEKYSLSANGSFVHSILLSEDKKEPGNLLKEYNSFISDSFSPELNINMNLSLEPSFTLMPSGADYFVNNSEYSVVIDSDCLTKIDVFGNITDKNNFLNETIKDTKHGSLKIDIRLNDSQKNPLLVEKRSIDINKDNLFLLNFNSSTPSPAFYMNISNEKLTMNVSETLNASLELEYYFNCSGKNKIYLNSRENIIFKSVNGDFVKAGKLTFPG
ncbi:MAG: hypothetical protein ACQESF_01010 [Nanobdellota archaeon]